VRRSIQNEERKEGPNSQMLATLPEVSDPIEKREVYKEGEKRRNPSSSLKVKQAEEGRSEASKLARAEQRSIAFPSFLLFSLQPSTPPSPSLPFSSSFERRIHPALVPEARMTTDLQTPLPSHDLGPLRVPSNPLRAAGRARADDDGRPALTRQGSMDFLSLLPNGSKATGKIIR